MPSELPEIYYDNILNQSSVSISITSEVDSSGDYLNDYSKLLQWEAEDLTEQQINIEDNGGFSIAASALVIDNHNLSGISIELRGSTDDWGAVDNLVDSVTPSDNENILLRFSEVGYPYWRIVIAATSTAAKIGEMFLGLRVQLPKNPIIPHDPNKKQDTSETSFNSWGYRVSRERSLRKIFDLEFRGMNDDPQYEVWKTHWLNCRGFKPFYYSFRPVTVPEDTVLVLDVTGGLFCPLRGIIRSPLVKRFEEVF